MQQTCTCEFLFYRQNWDIPFFLSRSKFLSNCFYKCLSRKYTKQALCRKYSCERLVLRAIKKLLQIASSVKRTELKTNKQSSPLTPSYVWCFGIKIHIRATCVCQRWYQMRCRLFPECTGAYKCVTDVNRGSTTVFLPSPRDGRHWLLVLSKICRNPKVNKMGGGQ